MEKKNYFKILSLGLIFGFNLELNAVKFYPKEGPLSLEQTEALSAPEYADVLEKDYNLRNAREGNRIAEFDGELQQGRNPSYDPSDSKGSDYKDRIKLLQEEREAARAEAAAAEARMKELKWYKSWEKTQYNIKNEYNRIFRNVEFVEGKPVGNWFFRLEPHDRGSLLAIAAITLVGGAYVFATDNKRKVLEQLAEQKTLKIAELKNKFIAVGGDEKEFLSLIEKYPEFNKLEESVLEFIENKKKANAEKLDFAKAEQAKAEQAKADNGGRDYKKYAKYGAYALGAVGAVGAGVHAYKGIKKAKSVKGYFRNLGNSLARTFSRRK